MTWLIHDDVMISKRFPRDWDIVRRTHRLPMDSPHYRPFEISLVWTICRWFETPRRSCDVIVMERQSVTLTTTNIDILTVILKNTRQAIITTHPGIISGNGLSQWETTLQRNVVFHWLSPEWFLTSDCNTSYLNHYHDYVHLCMYKHIHITYSDGWDQILNIRIVVIWKFPIKLDSAAL